ncbi:2070_t:CDS:2, partial [Ambispora leptoticha]
ATNYKITSRKFPSLVYTFKENIATIQGFYNQKAIETEQIQLWWVMNWPEGQKRIEVLPKKPNLPSKLWKAIAFGSFVDLQEFTQKNLISNVKQMNEDTWKYSISFGSISEWLLAFKSYMDAVLILYENREQEINTYRDHIYELCTKYKFSAVMGYDEDRRIALVINRDSTLFEKDIEAEGKNFDIAAIKRLKDEVRPNNW